MTAPTIAAKAPIAVDVTAGQDYWWCSCGKSAKQPFCDGSHKGSDFSPVKFSAEKDETVYFCACKSNKGGVKCDGSHKAL